MSVVALDGEDPVRLSVALGDDLGQLPVELAQFQRQLLADLAELVAPPVQRAQLDLCLCQGQLVLSLGVGMLCFLLGVEVSPELAFGLVPDELMFVGREIFPCGRLFHSLCCFRRVVSINSFFDEYGSRSGCFKWVVCEHCKA